MKPNTQNYINPNNIKKHTYTFINDPHVLLSTPTISLKRLTYEFKQDWKQNIISSRNAYKIHNNGSIKLHYSKIFTIYIHIKHN